MSTRFSADPERVASLGLHSPHAPRGHQSAVGMTFTATITTNPLQFEVALLKLVAGLAQYAGAHVRTYGAPVADDGYTGKAWQEAIKAVNALLTCERGRLDGGTVHHTLQELYKAAGFKGEL